MTQPRLSFFRDLMLFDHSICTWCYDNTGNLLCSNCPQEPVFAAAFDVFGCLKRMLAAGKERDAPLLLSAPSGLIWGAVFERQEETCIAAM